MDDARAARMQGELMNTSVGGWKIVEYLGAGKSALVFAAEKENITGALKIFDPELVQRFGTDVQAARIDRELRLRGKTHPNLVRIFDGGYCKESSFFFIVMERLGGESLADAIKKVPKDLIWPIISQIASAAKYLEELNLVHRDIKPDNIFLSADYRQACLMDFGVIRPVGEPGITDGDQRPFIGTLQYSSPEFLFRTEDDTPEGWRALTFYQLGAVLHDLITGNRIFAAYASPFAALVDAVKNITPEIEAPDVPRELILLARSCLSKDSELRLKLVHWSDFDPVFAKQNSPSATEERIRKRQLLARGSVTADPSVEERAAQTMRRTVDHVEERIQSLIRKECVGSELFPPPQIFDWQGSEPEETFFFSRFEASRDHALAYCFQVWFSVRLLDPTSVAICLTGAASISVLPLDSDAYDSTSNVVLFEGILDETILEERLRRFLYVALDQAQSAASETLETEVPAVRWLSCVEDFS
jgi:serine/threonine protein kinase